MMSQTNEKQSNKKYLILLITVIGLAVAVYVLTKGRLDISLLAKTLSAPTDTEENLAYGLLYRPSSEHVLERDGIVLKNFGTELMAEDLSKGVLLRAGNIAARSGKSIVQFSEYVGYFYMYDGETVYRTNVDGSELKAAVKDCLKFEPMGTYLYSLKMVHGRKRLFRCSIIGTYEKMLFKEEVLDFWAYGGHLLMLNPDGIYRYYSVLTKNTFTHTLPEGAARIRLDENGILYLSKEDERGHQYLHRRAFLAAEDQLVLDIPVEDYSVGEKNIALLLPEEYSTDTRFKAAWCQSDGSELQVFEGKEFPPGCALDGSAHHLFVTEADGNTYYTPLSDERWEILFDE